MRPSRILEHDETDQALRTGLHHADGVGRLEADAAKVINELRARNRKAATTHREVADAMKLTYLLNQTAVSRQMLAHVGTVPRPLKRRVVGMKAAEELAVGLPLRTVLEFHGDDSGNIVETPLGTRCEPPLALFKRLLLGFILRTRGSQQRVGLRRQRSVILRVLLLFLFEEQGVMGWWSSGLTVSRP